MSEFVMGNRIKSMRQASGYTMEELGVALGVGKSAVNKWEKGHVKNIKRSTIEKMAKIFGCSPIWLMGMDEEVASYDNGFEFEKDWAAKGGGIHPLTLTPEEEQIIHDIRNADDQTREMLRRILLPVNSDKTVPINAIPVVEKIKVKPDHIPFLGDQTVTIRTAKTKGKKDSLA